MSSQPKFFQYHLAFWGILLFFVSLEIADFLSKKGHGEHAHFFIGYSLGFVFPYAMLIVLEILRGNINRFTDKSLMSYFCLFVIFCTGGLAFYTTNYMSISHLFNTSAGIGSIVSSFGLIPVLTYHND